MLLAVACGLLLLATLAAVTLPLLRPGHAISDQGQFDRAVYRDQLREVDRDISRGVLSAAEATSARLEIQRRLLAVEGRSGKNGLQAGRSPLAAAAVGGFVLIASVALYLRLGSPGLPDMPFASRGDNVATMVDDGGKHLDMADAAIKLRAKLAQNPNDAEGWVLYARTESILGNWDKARDAYDHAISLGQTGPDVMASYGEMLVLAEQGIVPPVAKQVFTKVLAGDPKNDVARYYLALAAAQSGEPKKAIQGWLSLAADVPQDSPMRKEIARQIEAAAKTNGMPVPALPKGQAPQAQPSAADAAMQAAQELPPAQRKQMVGAMVARLADSLKKNPNDLDGWMQLGRSYTVLGERDKAADAYRHAEALKPGDIAIKLREAEALLIGLKPTDALPTRAISLLREVEKVAPDQPEALWYLGVVAARNGDNATARGYWTRLLKQLPAGSEDAKLVQAALNQVKGP